MVRVINIDTKTRTIRVSNGKDDLEWFTTDTGSHVPLKKGQSKAEAIKEHFGDKKSNPQLERLEKIGKAWGKDQMSVLRELGKTNPQGLKDELDRIDTERERTTKAHKEWLKGKDATKPAKQESSVDPELEDLYDNYGSKDDRSLMKDIEEHYVKTVAFYGKDSRDAISTMRDYRKASRLTGIPMNENPMQGRTIEFEKDLPAKKETPDTSNADYFKSTMQETMKKFPRLYEHEQKHLEEYAVSAFSALRNNPGKEKAIVDEILDSYNQHVKRLGMWVDTPTLAKKAFVEKLAEAYK